MEDYVTKDYLNKRLDKLAEHITSDIGEQISDSIAYMDERFNKIESLLLKTVDQVNDHESRITKLDMKRT